MSPQQLTRHFNRFNNVIFPNGTHQATVKSGVNLLKNGGADNNDTTCVMDMKNASRQSISEWIHTEGNVGVRPIDYRAPNNIFYNRSFTEYPLLSRCYFGNLYGLRFTSIEQTVDMANFKRLINDQRARFTLIAWLTSTAHVNLTFLQDRRFLKDEKAAVTLFHNNPKKFQRCSTTDILPRNTVLVEIKLGLEASKNSATDDIEFFLTSEPIDES